MLDHIKNIGILMIALGILGLVVAVGCLIAFGGFAGIMGNDGYGRPGTLATTPVWGIFSAFLAVFSIIMGPLMAISGFGLYRLRPWARSMSIILCALNILSVPLGTVLGIYALWALLSPEVEPLFDEGYGRGPIRQSRFR